MKSIKDLRQGRLPPDFCEKWPEEVTVMKCDSYLLTMSASFSKTLKIQETYV